MKNILLFLFIFVLFNTNAQETKIKIINQDKEALAFVKVYFLPDGSFTSTDNKGFFSVDRKFFDAQKQILITGYGLGDTLLAVSQLTSNQIISLKIKEIDLPQFTISSKELKSVKIGDKKNPIKNPENVLKIFDSGVIKDTRYATWIKLPNRKEKLISKIHFFVSNVGSKDKQEISLRFLGSNSHRSFKPENIYSSNDLIDFASKPIIVSIDREGWHTVELVEKVTIIEKVNEIFLVFDLLQFSDTFSLAYQYSKRGDLQMAFNYPEKSIIGRFDKNPEGFAVVLEILVGK